MAGENTLTCERHRKPTRIRCVTCDTPICPDCVIKTPVGFKCPDHASRPPKPRRSRAGIVALAVVVLTIAGFVQFNRSRGPELFKPPCPTQTAPDVGIGPEGGSGKWTELETSRICGRYYAASAWTGEDLLIWGGENCAGTDCPSRRAPRLADGGAYSPSRNKWRRLAASPLSPRGPVVSAWTGTEMLVWGGTTGDGGVAGDGAAYDPKRDRWRALATAPISPRTGAAAVWTGDELVIWGGAGGDGVPLADGAAYDPSTDGWRTLEGTGGAASPRTEAIVAWTGKEMVVWGGTGGSPGGEVAELRDGAAYDPAADRWRRLAPSPLPGRTEAGSVWTGRELVIWGGGGEGNAVLFATGAAYDPAADRWRSLPASPLGPRSGPAAVWSGSEVLIWGGIAPPADPGRDALDRVIQRRTFFAPASDGAAYDPAANRWRPLEPVALLGRGLPITAWDGESMIVWGGLVAVSSAASASDGVRYKP